MTASASGVPGASDPLEFKDPHEARRPHALDVMIGNSLRARRRNLGLSQQTLAGRCGLSFQQIQKYEAGTNRIPASRLFTLANALNTTPTDLLTRIAVAEQQAHDEVLRKRLYEVMSGLSGEGLAALVTLAEQIADKSPETGA